MPIYVLIPFLLLINLMSNAALAANQPVKGAACVIVNKQNKLLVIEELNINKYSIPGGHVIEHSSEQGAIRETKEETGIDVKVIRALFSHGGSIVYACQSIAPIPVIKSKNATLLLPSWIAPDFGREVKAAFFTPITRELILSSRYPFQMRKIRDMINTLPKSNVQMYSNFSELGSEFEKNNAQINVALQQSISALPSPLSAIFHSGLRLITHLGSSALFVLLLPFAIATGGLKRAAQCLLVALIVTSSTTVAKLVFAIPRPFYLYPELQLDQAFGFAFPSGHSATAFAVFGLIYYWCNHQSSRWLTWKLVCFWLLPASLVAISRVYLGLHYITDVIAGGFIGLLALQISRYIQQKNALLSIKLWLIISFISVLLALFELHAALVYASVLVLFFTLSLYLSGNKIAADNRYQTINPFNFSLFITYVLIILFVAINLFSLQSYSSNAVVLISSAFYFAMLGFLLPYAYFRSVRCRYAALQYQRSH